MEFCHDGIVGLCTSGKETAKRLKGFGCKVSYYNVNPVEKEIASILNVSYLDIEEIYKQCDILNIFVIVLSDTIEMKNAILINTSRGEIVNHENLKEAIIIRGNSCGRT